MSERIDASREWIPIDDAVYLDTAAHAVMPRAAAAAAERAIAANLRPDRVDDAAFFEVSDGLRAAIASLIGGSPEEVALTTGASTGLQTVAQHIDWRSGDGIVISGGDFPLHYAVWKAMEARANARLTIVEPRDGALRAEDVCDAIDERTRVVSLSHVRFDTGAVIDTERIAEACRAAGALLVLDISQSCGAVPIDAGELRADAIVCAGYKWLLGPYGTGFLWVKEKLLDELLPGPFYWTGQDAADFFSLRFDRPEPSRGARRWDAAESATPFHLNLAALRASIDVVARLGTANVLRHGHELIDALFERLPDHCSVASPRNRAERGAFGSFAAGSADATAALFHRLREARFYVSLRQGKIRVAPHLFNSIDQVARLADEVRRLA